MSRLITKACKYCGKPAKAKSFFTLDSVEYVTLECGHTLISEKSSEADYSDFISEDGRSLYPFQIDGCKFAEASNFHCLIADEMGLGKTVQALAILKKHPELLPCAVFTKTSLKHQWFAEVVRWTGLIPQIIEGNDKPSDIFKVFIISVDLLRSLDWLNDWSVRTVIIDECQSIKNIQSKRTHAIRNFLKKGFTTARKENNSIERDRIEMIARNLIKYHGISDRFELKFANIGSHRLGLCECRSTKEGIIVGKIIISENHCAVDTEDEIIETILHEIAHAITPGAGHKNIWRETAIAIGSTGEIHGECEGTVSPREVVTDPIKVIALSGTPIKNRINEYFPILNILRPEIFYSPIDFERNWVGEYWDGRKRRKGNLINPKRFQEATKDFIIRRERNEVLPDLPKINRQFHYTDLSAIAEREYKRVVKEFIEFNEEREDSIKSSDRGQILAYLTRMRHIVGKAKIDVTVDFVKDFLFDTDRKLTIFVHHKDVGELIKEKLISICQQNDCNEPLQLTSDQDALTRNETIMKFKNDQFSRIMIASTLASGEGLNLQFCSDCIMVERQWNPANEEQAEGRFSRIGSLATSISATYMTAIGTIDEFFMKLVENKRKLIKEAMTGEKVNWNESEILSELTQMICKHGRKEWGF